MGRGRVHYSDDLLTTRTIYVKTVKDSSKDISPYAITTASTIVGGLHETLQSCGQKHLPRTARMMSHRPLRSSRCRPKHSWSLQWRCPFPTEEASDAVGHLPRPPKAATQCVVVEAAQTCQIPLQTRNLELEAPALVPRALRSSRTPLCSGIALLRRTNEPFRTETGVFHVHRSLSLASKRTSLGKSIAACAIRMKGRSLWQR